jgi:hypothetical protein
VRGGWFGGSSHSAIPGLQVGTQGQEVGACQRTLAGGPGQRSFHSS